MVPANVLKWLSINLPGILWKENRLRCTGDGSTRRDYTYVDDIISGIVSAFQRVKGFEIVNLGESRTTSLVDLVHILEENIGKKAIIQQLPEQPGDVNITCADIRKAKELLDYNPSTSIEEGISKFVSWMKNAR